MTSGVQNPELLAAEGRGFANAARAHDLEGRLEEARISYLKAAEKFVDAALAGDLKDKQMRLDFAKLFYTKAMELKRELEKQGMTRKPEMSPPANIQSMILVQKPDVTFDQIGGLDSVKEILKMEVVYPFQERGRELYKTFGREPGTGVLLYGPPGCGKTMLAKAIARETDAVFIAPKISDIMNMYVGESEKRINEIFTYARECGRSVIFLDELDGILPRHGPSYVQRIKNELLQQMDGIYSKKENILILGGSNKPWRLDTALIRPGRLGKMIFIPPPDFEARKKIFQIHLKTLISNNMLEDVDFDLLAEKTEGFSGADIEAICRDAVDIPLYEALKGGTPRKVRMSDFLSALEKKQKSIVPWFKEAIKSIKEAGEEEIFESLIKSAQEYLSKNSIALNF